MILLFDLIYPCKKLRREKAVYVCRFTHGGDTFPLGTTSLLQGRFRLQEAYTKACPNSAKKITATCSCHAKFHDFQACFGITGIKKPSFSIFPAEPRRPDVWISFPFVSWDLEIHPRTHMWFCNQLWCIGACAHSSHLYYAHKMPRKPSWCIKKAKRTSKNSKIEHNTPVVLCWH